MALYLRHRLNGRIMPYHPVTAQHKDVDTVEGEYVGKEFRLAKAHEKKVAEPEQGPLKLKIDDRSAPKTSSIEPVVEKKSAGKPKTKTIVADDPTEAMALAKEVARDMRYKDDERR